jgi:hypothetical protein
MNLDTMRPSSQNDANRGATDIVKPSKYSSGITPVEKQRKMRSAKHMAPTPEDKSFNMRPSAMGPQATSMPGSMGIIQDVMKPGKGAMGVPGIISSTTLGPEVRQRLVTGIIESPMERSTDQGPVSKVAGHDSTAYNAGMIHLAGSRF